MGSGVTCTPPASCGSGWLAHRPQRNSDLDQFYDEPQSGAMPDGWCIVRNRAICSTFNVAERRFRLRAGIGPAEKSFSTKEGVDECSERTIFVSLAFKPLFL